MVKEAQEAMAKEKAAENETTRERAANELTVQAQEKMKKVTAKAKARQYNTVAVGPKELAQGLLKIVGTGTRRLAETGKQAPARKEQIVDFYIQL